MKTQLLLFALITSLFATQIQAQDTTIVNAQNSEISDNLDLRVVASVFGDSQNLQDFERRLNDPQLQISNLDLNNDGQVDYLRVIESVQNNTHIVIIQAVLDRDLYQDVATIEVQKNWNNNVQVQVVGNSYFYGPNYIYQPVYYNTPLIYASFWMSNYHPYYSSWSWNYYPSYYYAWNTYPVFRYRHNVNISLNNYSYNHYNYVSNGRSYYTAPIYNSNRSNAYEKQHPDYSFSKRNAAVNNRYALDQIRNTRNIGTRNRLNYSQNRDEISRETTPQRTVNQRNYTQNRTEPQNVATQQRTVNQRDYSQNRTEPQNVATPQRTVNQRDYSQNRTESQSVATPRRTVNQRDYSQNRTESSRETSRQNAATRNSSTNEKSNYSRNNNNRRT